MNKKAQQTNIEMYFFLFELFMVIVVGSALFTYVYSIRDSTLFEKLYLSKDVALTLSTLSFVPGNVELNYSTDKTTIDSFHYSFSNNKVSVVEKPGQDKQSRDYGLPAEHPYSKDQRNIFFEKPVREPQQLIFSKNGNDIKINEQTKLNKLYCDKISLNKPATILLDVDSTQQQFIKVTEILTSIVQGDITYTTTFQPEKNEKLSIKEIEEKKRQADLYLRIESTNNPTQVDILRAYYPFLNNNDIEQQSRTMGCNIINTLLSNKDLSDIKGVSVVPLDLTEFDQTILNGETPELILQIGNTRYPNNVFSNEKRMNTVASTLNKALLELQ